MNLAPLIPELLKDFDYKQKAIAFSFTPAIPTINVLGHSIKASLSETPLSLFLTGST
jgi:hypothetical protein